MAPTSESQKDEIIKYLLLVMKHTDFKPDYHKIAQESGLSNANAAQKRFKKSVEFGGFALVRGVVTEAGGSDAAPATPTKPKARSKKSAATPTSAKKRKARAMTPYGEEDEDEDEDAKHQVGSGQED